MIFIGLSNYLKVFSSERALNALRNSIFFVFTCLLIEIPTGLSLALLLNKDIKGIRIFRTLLLAPLMVPPVVYSLQFRWMFTDQYGIVNHILAMLGINGPLWLADPNVAMYACVITMVWAAIPFVTIVVLAGLQSIPQDLYEAAKIDGASSWSIFKSITLPLLKPALLFVLLIRTIDALKMFDIFYVLTGGGPAYATETAPLYIYRLAFTYLDFGMASVLSVIMIMLSLTICLFIIRVMKIEV